MTAPRRRPYAVRLDAEACGTMLGALAWVLGALEIMKDRGHAENDERWHELSDQLTPRLEQLVAELAGTRAAAGEDAAREAAVEDAYAAVRGAFEAWIGLTATDTIAAALEQRLASGAPPPDAHPTEGE